MAQYQITVDSQALHQLFVNKSKDSGVPAMLESVLNQTCRLKHQNNLKQNLTGALL